MPEKGSFFSESEQTVATALRAQKGRACDVADFDNIFRFQDVNALGLFVAWCNVLGRGMPAPT